MLTYIAAFIFYTFAMVGVLLVGYVIYKKTSVTAKSDEKGMIKVLDSIHISPRKSLIVVKVKNERFLIASDVERTTFLAKLNDEVKNKSKTNEPDVKEIVSEPKAAQKIQNNVFNQTQQDDYRELYSDNEIIKKFSKHKADRKELIRNLLSDYSKNNQ